MFWDDKKVKKTKKIKLSDILFNLLIFLLVITILISGFLTFKFFYEEKKVGNEMKDINEIVQQEIKKSNIKDMSEDVVFTPQAFQSLEKINEDMIAYISFDSGLFSLPVVQSYDNDYYLRKNLSREYSVLGVPFMDYRCKLDDQNITIYGHNSAYDEKVMFSPLRNILEQDEFNKNDIFTVYFKDEYRKYQIVAMYFNDVENNLNEDNDYSKRKWNKEEFKTYFSFVESRNLIKANTKYSQNDYFMTLQTCRSWKPNERLTVVAKEIKASVY